MNENDVASIAEQFGLDKEIVEASAKDGTLSQRIKDAMNEKVVYNKNEFETFQTNLKAKTEESYFAQLVENAKKGDLPQDLYAPVKGAAYEQLERDLAKKYEVNDYRDVQDLIEKAVKKSSANVKGGEDFERQLDELKQANLRLEEEKKNALQEVEQKYKLQAIDKEKSSLLNSVPFDFSGLKSEEVDSVKKKTQTMLKSVFDTTYELDYNDKGALVVRKKDGEVLVNNATLDPVPASDVMVNLAKEYNLKLASPDSGGQGGRSSAGSGKSYASVEEFEADMAAKGISSTDPAYIKHYKASGLGNRK